MPKDFSNDETHKIEAFPAGEGADQRMRREADEGYAKTASSVKERPVHFTNRPFMGTSKYAPTDF